MSLSEDVRAELAAIEPRKPCCRLAEVSALVRGAGSAHLLGGGRLAVHLDVASPAVARRAFALLRAFGVASEVRSYRRRAFGREARYQLHLDGEGRALQTLEEAGVLDARLAPLAVPPRRVVSRACCRAAYVRGALLAAGSVSGPRDAHLEIRVSTREAAELLVQLGAEDDLRLGMVERDGHLAVYAKGREAVADVLALAGAQEAALGIGESGVVAQTRAHANRLANADHANLVRTTRSAQDELRAIRRLQADGQLQRLSPDLQEIAELRLRHPSLSVRELAGRCRPPRTKAAVHRRLKRLEKLGEP